MRNGIAFFKGKGSRSELELAVSGYKNKVMDTESYERFEESGP